MVGVTVPPDIKAAKESFISNLEGTSHGELLLVATLLPHLALLSSICRCCLASSGSTPPLVRRAASFMADYACLVVPMVAVLMAATTPQHMHLLAGLLAAGLWSLLGYRIRRSCKLGGAADDQTRFISEYRGGLMLVTAISILAVDFSAFPRRYAKAERFGTGLMDIGVGAFVFANGLVRAASLQRHPHQLRQPVGRRLAVGLRKVAALLVLGLARVASMRSVNYPQHVGEYGVHWNFFFTLAAVKLLTTMMPLPAQAMLPMGTVVVAAYQVALSYQGGQLIAWVHSDDRSGYGLLSLNKEGLCSALGYWGLYMLSVGLCGMALRWVARGDRRQQQQQQQAAAVAAAGLSAGVDGVDGGSHHGPINGAGMSSPSASPHKADAGTSVGSSGIRGSGSGGNASLRASSSGKGAGGASFGPWGALALMLALDGALWALLAASVLLLGQPVSRRACNAPYCLWMLAINLLLLSGTRAAQLTLPGSPPGLLAALSYNMLPLFLVANLLTGAVNIGINTLALGPAASRVVVAAYMVAVAAPAAAAFSFRKRLRLS